MALKGVVQYLTCPMCDADVPLSEDEKAGEEVYCPYCQVPLKVKKKKGSEELFLEENF